MKKVCVQGLGFVGVAMATVVASAKENNKPLYDVVGVELDTQLGRKRVETLNLGKLPFFCEDKFLEKKLNEAIERGNFKATTNEETYGLADIVIIDINLDVKKNKDNYFDSQVYMGPFKDAIRTLGSKIKPDCLILLETTVPPGTTQNIVKQVLIEEFDKRGIQQEPLICHSYERVMPGKKYMDSIINFWRSYSTTNKSSKEKAERFLTTLINTKQYPLTYFISPTSTEIAKVLENSYRALNISFIQEWTVFAEKSGVNLFDVIDSIKLRKGTHDNMMYPGFGVGGYCLTKDSLLAEWSIKNIFNLDGVSLPLSIEALKINDRMPDHTYNLITENVSIKKKKVLICGVSYIADVGDIRNTPTKRLYDQINLGGGICYVTDPIVTDYGGMFDKDRIVKDPNWGDYDIIVFAVRHKAYIKVDPDKLSSKLKKGVLVVDGFNIFSDEKIIKFLRKGISIVGVGKGHIPRLREELEKCGKY